MGRPRLRAVLLGIRSAYNVGSMFRTADALGVEKLYLVGITPRPDARGRAGRDIAKTALGAEQTVQWEHRVRFADAVRALEREGFSVVALEQAPAAVPIQNYRPKGSIALVVGPEVKGMSRLALARCDTIVEIPMAGTKESLNVSVAFGVAGYLIKLKNQNANVKMTKQKLKTFHHG